MDNITLDPQPPIPQISLGDTPLPLNEAAASTRSTKAWMGLGPVTGQDYDQIYGQITQGNEGTFRDGAAAVVDYKSQDHKRQQLVDLYKQEKLTPEAVDQIINSKTDPSTIIERAYAQAYMNKVAESSDRIPDNPVAIGQMGAPDVTKNFKDRAEMVHSIRELAITTAQNDQSDVDADPWFNIPFTTIGVGSRTAPIHTLLNWGTLGVYGGLREEYLLRGNTPSTSRFSGILAGENIEQQALEIYSQPTADQARELFLKGYNRIKAEDPATAQQWAMGIAGMSTNDMVVRDLMSSANIAFGIGALKGVKTGLQAIGRAQLGRSLSEAIASGAKNPLEIKEVQKNMAPLVAEQAARKEGLTTENALDTPELWALQHSMEDFLKHSPEAPTKAGIADAAGDTKEAAVQKVIEAVNKPNPTQEAEDTLLSMHRVQKENVLKNPGNNSREEQTRILDAIEGSEQFTAQTIKDTEKVVRNPALAENGYRDIADRVKTFFRGLESSVVDIDAFAEKITNTIHHVVTLGNYDGRAFTSAQQALNFARMNKLDGVKISGQDPKILYLSKEDVTHPGFNVRKDDEGKYSFHISTSIGEPARMEGKKYVPGNMVSADVRVHPSVDPIPGSIPFDISTGKLGKELVTGPHIVQKGLGYHIKYYIPLNEQDDFIRDHYLITGPRTKSASSGRGFISDLFNNSFLGYLRLPQDRLSAAEVENRIKAVNSSNRYYRLIMNEMQHVNNLYNGLMAGENSALSYFGNLTGKSKQIWNDFKRALTVAQKYPDPETGLPGYYFKTPLEIQHFWQTSFGRPASLAEQQAYLAVQRMDHQDWIFRNIGVYKNKARRGVMEHTLVSTSEGNETRSVPFEGRLLRGDEFKASSEIPTVIHSKDGSMRMFNSLSKDQRKDVAERFRLGTLKGIHIDNPDEYPTTMKDRNGKNIRVVYLLSDNMESRPLSFKQVGYRSGGHWDYNYEHYVKQPTIHEFTVGSKKHVVYGGDSTYAPIKNKVDGETLAKNLNNVRRLMKSKKFDEAKKAHELYSDQPWNEFKAGFYPGKDGKPARFNLDHDFQVIPRGLTIGEHDPDFVNKFRALEGVPKLRLKFTNASAGQLNPSRQFHIEYTQMRDSHDLFEPVNTGTKTNPFYKFQPAELVDPLVAQSRALRRIMNSAVMDDYKYSAVEHWLQENMKYLDVDSKKEARHSPFATFMNNNLSKNWRFDIMGQGATISRWQIQKLIGMPTYMDTQIHMIKQALADQMYRTDNPLAKKLLIPPTWLLGKIRSPTSFLRGMAFHENLGLFNWMQLASQNAAYVNFFALSPGHTLPGIFGSWMHLWSRVNKDAAILASMGKKAEFFGWKPGEWQEAMRLYENSGFNEIGSTLAIHDPDAKFLLSNADKALRVGSKYFFELAEQNVRHGSWYTAFHEYKRAFPNKVIDSIEVGKILRRANDLYANMGRDSKTVLSSGVFSLPLQFFKYIENVGHLFLSKRIGDVFGKENTGLLRAQQRAQMIAMYSLMFGPVGAAGLSLFPVSDMLRKRALAKGLPWDDKPYVPGDNFWSTMVMEGPASYAGAYVSGWWRGGDASNGTFYNFNNRYGPNNSVIRDLLENSTTFWGFILGASGSTIAQNLASISPFAHAWSSAYNDEQDNPFKLTFSDWSNNIARNINSWRAADRLRVAIQFGKWIDRHGRPQDTVGKYDAIFRTLLGVNDVTLDDLYLMRKIQEDRRANLREATSEWQRLRRLQDQAIENGDHEQAVQYGKDANWILQSYDVPREEAARMFRQDAGRNTTTKRAMYDSFYLKLVPQSEREANRKAYQEHYRQMH